MLLQVHLAHRDSHRKWSDPELVSSSFVLFPVCFFPTQQRMLSSAIAVIASTILTASASPIRAGRRIRPSWSSSYGNANRTRRIGSRSVGKFPSPVSEKDTSRRPAEEEKSIECLISIFFAFRSSEQQTPPGNTGLWLREIGNRLLCGGQRGPSRDGLPVLDGPLQPGGTAGVGNGAGDGGSSRNAENVGLIESLTLILSLV